MVPTRANRIPPGYYYPCLLGCPASTSFRNLKHWAAHLETAHKHIWTCTCGREFPGRYKAYKTHVIEHGHFHQGDNVDVVIYSETGGPARIFRAFRPVGKPGRTGWVDVPEEGGQAGSMIKKEDEDNVDKDETDLDTSTKVPEKVNVGLSPEEKDMFSLFVASDSDAGHDATKTSSSVPSAPVAPMGISTENQGSTATESPDVVHALADRLLEQFSAADSSIPPTPLKWTPLQPAFFRQTNPLTPAATPSSSSRPKRTVKAPTRFTPDSNEPRALRTLSDITTSTRSNTSHATSSPFSHTNITTKGTKKRMSDADMVSIKELELEVEKKKHKAKKARLEAEVREEEMRLEVREAELVLERRRAELGG